mmetsp:Transcript_101498/g.254443  ORF Transcript_101498/g.254443 Transcript_101498/m.254443 type:complete len:337 (-) Transcript_101498:816-1826(-)
MSARCGSACPTNRAAPCRSELRNSVVAESLCSARQRRSLLVHHLDRREVEAARRRCATGVRAARRPRHGRHAERLGDRRASEARGRGRLAVRAVRAAPAGAAACRALPPGWAEGCRGNGGRKSPRAWGGRAVCNRLESRRGRRFAGARAVGDGDFRCCGLGRRMCARTWTSHRHSASWLRLTGSGPQQHAELLLLRQFYGRSCLAALLGWRQPSSVGLVLLHAHRGEVHRRGPISGTLRVQQAAAPAVLAHGSEDQPQLLARRDANSLPRQDCLQHERKNSSEQRRLRHVLHLLDVQDGRRAVARWNSALCLCDVPLHRGSAAEVVLSTDQQEGHC